MPDQRREVARELSRLVRTGTALYLGLEVRRRSKESREEMTKAIKVAEKAQRKASKGTKESEDAEDLAAMAKMIESEDFGGHYQGWYSEALRAVEQLLPDRYEEFRAQYRLEKRKTLDVSTYTISDYIHGTRVPRENIDDATARTLAITKAKDQTDILSSAERRLDSILADIEGSLEATLLDNELEAAAGLLKAKHIRSAGVVAGVVLERHLRKVVDNHELSLGRKKAQITSLNDILKDAKVFDNPRWREVQRLGDIRNLCAHAGEREPKREEVQELIDGVERIIKTVF